MSSVTSSMPSASRDAMADSRPQDADMRDDGQDANKAVSPILSFAGTASVPSLQLERVQISNTGSSQVEGSQYHIVENSCSYFEHCAQTEWKDAGIPELTIPIRTSIEACVEFGDSQGKFAVPPCVDFGVPMTVTPEGAVEYDGKVVGYLPNSPSAAGPIFCCPLSKRWYIPQSNRAQGMLSDQFCREVMAGLMLAPIKEWEEGRGKEIELVPGMLDLPAFHELTPLRVKAADPPSYIGTILACSEAQASNKALLDKWDKFASDFTSTQLGTTLTKVLVQHGTDPGVGDYTHRDGYSEALQREAEKEMAAMLQRLRSKFDQLDSKFRTPPPRQ